MPNNGGWHIADDEKVELTENGFKPRKHKQRTPQTEQAERDRAGQGSAGLD
ncbi:MAG: hypothetical protein ACOYCB_10030 [Fastidiosipilaceae bacterium]